MALLLAQLTSALVKRACYSFSISIRNWGTLTLESGLDLRFLDESVLRVTSLSSWIFTSPKHVRPNADARPPKKKSCTPALRCRPAKVLVKTVWLRSVGLSRYRSLPAISTCGNGLWIEISFLHRCVVGIKTSIHPGSGPGSFSDSDTPTLGMPYL